MSGCITLVDQSGLAGVSMRDLAAALGVRPSSLYNHFASRNDVLDAAFSQLLAHGFTPARAALDWSGQLQHFAQQLRAFAQQHPHFLPYFVRDRQGALPQELAVLNQLTTALDEAGVPATHVLTLALHFLVSLTQFFHYVLMQGARTPMAETFRTQAQSAAFPTLAQATAQHDPQLQEYTVLVELYIAGVRALSTAAQAER